MRTAAGVLAEIKAEDPATEVTLHYIRYLIKANKVPVVQVGRKKLVSVDAVLSFLADGTPPEEDRPFAVQVRRIEA
jgi:hypothetical protein